MKEFNHKPWVRVLRLTSFAIFGWLGTLCIEKRVIILRQGTVAEGDSAVLIGYGLIIFAVVLTVREVRKWRQGP